jgi:hypothetical protein
MEKTLSWARSVLSGTPHRWASLCGTLPADLLRRPPAPGEWSVLECLRHLVETEKSVFPPRVGCFLRGEDFPGFDPDKAGKRSGGTQDPAELAGEFARLRDGSLTLLSGIAPADLGRKARHQELGIVTLGMMIHEWAGHDLMHTVQGEQALMQPFIEECGPWKPYFAAHVARK